MSAAERWYNSPAMLFVLFPSLAGGLVAAFWTNATMQQLQWLLSALALALWGWGLWLARSGRPESARRLRDGLLAAVGLLGAASYFNFGLFDFHGQYVNLWDTYHYYMGAKYFPELRYDLLYDCTVIADAELKPPEVVGERVITDLRTNHMVEASDVLADPGRCTSRFTPERWDGFRRDLVVFREGMSAKRWARMLQDHGFNGTPVWLLGGRALAGLFDATRPSILAATLVDPLLLAGAFALVAWAFGWRVAAVAVAVFGTTFPNRFNWNGGAFLRYDWFFLTTAAICLARRGRHALAGACLAYAALLRLFPGVLVAGPALALVQTFVAERRLDARYVRFFAGAAVAGAALLGASLAFNGGLPAYREFAHNTRKHADTPLGNHMGLRTVLSYRNATIGARMRDSEAIDPWGEWKKARSENFAKLRPLFLLAGAGAFALLYLAVRESGGEPWIALALSALLIAVFTELTGYYYSFLAATAVLVSVRREVGLYLLGFTFVSQCIGLARIPGVYNWDDEKYVALSIAALIALALTVWSFAPSRARR